MSYGTDTPFGLTPVSHLQSLSYNGTQRAYPIDTTAGDIYTGSPVMIQADGTARSVTGATAQMVGVANAIAYQVDSPEIGNPGFYRKWKNGTAVKANTVPLVYVIDDPYVLFAVQSNNATGIAATDVGNNADTVNGTAGDDTTGISSGAIDQTSIGTGATKSLRIVGLYQDLRNAWSQAYNVVTVIINNHAYKGGTTGV